MTVAIRRAKLHRLRWAVATWLTWELPICEGNTMVKFLMNTQELALQRGFTISCGGNHREQIYRILKELS